MAKKKVEEPKKVGAIITGTVEEVLHNSMIPYAECVILDRALPRVEDGLKPVQRRILYAMSELGLSPDKPHKKCARIVGECMGKYHPHGDSSVYDALVRMAQNFNMRMTLVNGHGNFGSVDGDSAAAMRYTEAKLEPLALELLRDIDKNTVNFNLNFDDTLKEPETMPGRYPNLLVNGSSGIAVGLATNIPPHNLAEVIDGTVAYIDNPKIKLDAMMRHIKAPDFPTGGIIAAGEGLVQAYETGRGKIMMRAKVAIEQGEYEKKLLVITELPYQVNKASLLKRIADLREEKKDILGGISEIVDESDRNGMRAVVKIKKDADAKKILDYLYKYTDLECSFGINMVAIAGGKPKQMGLLEIISYYVEYQREVILRRTKYDLAEAKDRCHILEGLIVAVKNIDEVIKIIKEAANVSDARAKLRVRFDLSERQAQAILDLRLARLTKLEVTRLADELKALKEKIKELTAIVESKRLQMDVVKTELLAVKRQYKDARRSEIVGAVTDVKEASYDDEVPLKEYVAVWTAGGTFKKVTAKNYKMSDRKVDENSVPTDVAVLTQPVTNQQTLVAFTNLGNAYKIAVDDAPECKYRDKGCAFRAVCGGADVKEYPVAFFIPEEEKEGDLLFYTAQGQVKRTDRKEYNVAKNVYQAIKLKDGDELLGVEEDKNETTVMFITEKGMSLNAEKDDIPQQGRVAGGVRGIMLSDGDKVVYAAQIDDEGEVIVATTPGLVKRVISYTLDVSARSRKGVKIAELGSKEKVIFADYVTMPYTLAYYEDGVGFVVESTDDVPIESRMGKGKAPKVKKKIKLSAVYSLEKPDGTL